MINITATNPVTYLPFVRDERITQRRIRRGFWHVERTADYRQACDKGREYAVAYLKYIKANPHELGLLSTIADDMAAVHAVAAPFDYTHGYAIGFFSYIDRVLRDALVGRSTMGVMA